jgi:uncharacterized coiled-coil DUF342 family protein
MGLRERLRDWLGVDGRIRDLVRGELAARSLAQASEVEALREQVQAAEARVASLEKKVKMTMGSVQASGAQLMGLHDALDKARAEAAQASQHATTARATAESVADGLEALEAQLAASSPSGKKKSRR